MKYPQSSLFDVIYYYQPPARSWRRHVTPQMDKVKRARDHRSFVLAAALVIENRLDSLLTVILPGYKTLLESRDLTFALKLGIAKSIRLFPDFIFDAADFFRVVRNDFAHNLRYELLSHMAEKRKDRLRYLITKLPYESRETTVRKMMDELFLHCALGLRLQQMNAELFRKVISTRKFKLLLKQEFPAFQRTKERLSS